VATVSGVATTSPTNFKELKQQRKKQLPKNNGKGKAKGIP
jgi:hypothetical protein